MVQNTSKRPRGRPPAYDRDRALNLAGDTFWNGGYAATTLDDLSAATGMNGAFGDKHALYLETLGRYASASQQKLEAFLDEDAPLADQLTTIYDVALGIYLSGDPSPRGCFLIGTALTEAVGDEAVRDPLLKALQAADSAFERRFGRAVASGELPPDADSKALAQVAAATLNALAVRARAGEAPARLRLTAATVVRLICDAAPAAVSPRRGPRRGR